MKVEYDTDKEPGPEDCEGQQTDEADDEEEAREGAVGERSVDLMFPGIGAQNGFHGSSLLSAFVRRYFSSGSDASDGPPPPASDVRAGSSSPYSLYLYVGVHLDGGQRTSVLLVGYIDLSSGLSVVELLDVLQLSADWVDSDTAPGVAAGAAADARLLISRLKEHGLPLGRLCVFYCNAPPAVSCVFERQLQAFSPRLVSLCGLPGIAGRACQVGLLAAFPHVVDIIRELHHHYSNGPKVADALGDVFALPYRPSLPVGAQPLAVVDIVEKMASSWIAMRDKLMLLGVQRVKEPVMDAKLELDFLFLSKALQPLRSLQVVQGAGAAHVAEQLQLIFVLLRSYAARFLHPSASSCFVRTWDLCILQDEENLLLSGDVDVGAPARDFLEGAGSTALSDRDRKDFFNAATTFYRAVLESLVQKIPKNLSKAALMSVTKVLKHPEDIYVSKLDRSHTLATSSC